MFYKDNEGTRYYIGTPFSYQGYFYSTILATHEKFIELGFTQVIVDPQPNGEFYSFTGPDLDGHYAVTPFDLDQLKEKFKLTEKKKAHDGLRKTDWYVTRSTELGVVAAAVPTEVSTYRAAWRTAADARCAQIDACTTVQELETLITAPATEPGTNPLDNIPNPAALSPWPTALDETTYYYS